MTGVAWAHHGDDGRPAEMSADRQAEIEAQLDKLESDADANG